MLVKVWMLINKFYFRWDGIITTSGWKIQRCTIELSARQFDFTINGKQTVKFS